MIKWKAHYGDMWEGLPVDVMPVSNGEFLPEAPTAEQIAIMELADERPRRLVAQFGMSRREFVRTAAAFSIGVWAINQITGTTWGGYNAYAPQHAHERCLRPRVSERAAQQPAGRVRLRRAEPPRRPERDVASDQPVDRGVLRSGLAAGRRYRIAQATRTGRRETPFRGGREVDPIENLGRFHYLKELYLDSSTNFTRPVGGAGRALQPAAADRRGRADRRHGQGARRRHDADRHACVRDAEPWLVGDLDIASTPSLCS